MSHDLDSFYTPSELASRLIGYTPASLNPRSVADFSGGNGDLLEAASNRFPRAKIFYNDLDSSAVISVLKRHSDWIINKSDFLNNSFYEGEFSENFHDLIVLNPPFSFRSRRLAEVKLRGEAVSCSGAVAFIARSLEMMSDDGVLLCVLPDGCFSRRADASAWALIGKHFKVSVLSSLGSAAFPSVRASTRIVRITKRHRARNVRDLCFPNLDSISLVRGSFQMHMVPTAIDKKGFNLVHTKDLQEGVVSLCGPTVSWHRSVRGPALLIPRVGRVDERKLCVLGRGKVVVISDCVIAVPAASVAKVKNIRSEILNRWSDFSKLYTGTGAPYITIEKLKIFLSHLPT